MTNVVTFTTIPVTELDQNCRVIANTSSKECVVVDPGGDVDTIAEYIAKNKLSLKGIYLTHSHFDHCGGVAALLRCHPDTPLYAHPQEKGFRGRVKDVAAMYGLGASFENSPEPTTYLSGGESIEIVGAKVKVLFVPGHAPGHLCFYFPEEKSLVAGDTLFAGSIGRTDLPYGDADLLLRSIKEKILSLPDDTAVMPGHGPDTVLSREKHTNPFLV
jgi:hydroxyacylglutathione hydrolase